MDGSPDVRGRIIAAANALYTRNGGGKFPSVAAVRHAAQADMNTTSAVMREWRMERQLLAEYEATQLALQERAEANLNLALLYQANGRADAVEPRLHAALQRDPGYLPALVALVQWLDGNFRWEEGRALPEKGLAEHPQSALLHHANGLMLVRKGELPAALKAFAEAVRLEPQNNQYDYVYAVALHDSGQLETASHRLERLLDRDPANREARLALINYWREAGQMQKVQALLAEP